MELTVRFNRRCTSSLAWESRWWPWLALLAVGGVAGYQLGGISCDQSLGTLYAAGLLFAVNYHQLLHMADDRRATWSNIVFQEG
ncbi:MAG: hypothetical protein IMX00_07705 [Limnochordales bacterium]|nr:hypothetical protein [Limnochordales bacterium]